MGKYRKQKHGHFTIVTVEKIVVIAAKIPQSVDKNTT
jgi:hypothetical protein